MKYTVKNKEHDQDNINFIDLTDPKKEMPSFLEYEDVLTFSLENGYIYDESEIKSLCDISIPSGAIKSKLMLFIAMILSNFNSFWCD